MKVWTMRSSRAQSSVICCSQLQLHHIQLCLIENKRPKRAAGSDKFTHITASCCFFDLIMRTTWSSIQIPALFTCSFMFTFQRILYALWRWFNGSFVSASNRRREQQEWNIPKHQPAHSEFSVGAHHKVMSVIINISGNSWEELAGRVERDCCWF